MTGADVIALALKDMGIKRVYIYPGGTIAPLLDAITSLGIEYICARNEQGAGYAAIGAAKVTGKTQVAIVTSGPGITNLLTPIADAFYDSVPLLAISGQVGTNDMNSEKLVRQTGFQETDSVGITSPVTKKSVIIADHSNIYNNCIDLISLTNSGRPGPVLIDLPMDVQREKYKNEQIQRTSDISDKKDINAPIAPISNELIHTIISTLNNSKRPIILAGNGIHISNSSTELEKFVDVSGIPLVSSMPGVGSIPSKHQLYYNYVGHTGEYFSNLALYHSDTVLCLGARLDLRQTGTELEHFNSKNIIRIDIDNSELIHGRVKGDLNINNDIKPVLQRLLNQWRRSKDLGNGDWINRIESWRDKYNSAQFYHDSKMSSYHVINEVDENTDGMKVIVSSGVGNHQQFAARYFSYSHPQRKWLTSAGHGTMGYDIPAAIGALIENNEYDYGLVFVGDGSFQMNIQELATIHNYKLPLKIFILDNRKLGIVSQFQLLNWEKDESTGDKINPSFSKIAEGYGIRGFDIYHKDDIRNTLSIVFESKDPMVIHCHIDGNEDLKPMLLAGQKMNEMYPFEEKI